MAYYRSCRPGFIGGQALIGVTAGIMIMTSILVAGLTYVRWLTAHMEDVATWSDESRMLAACACVSCPRVSVSTGGVVMLADTSGHPWAIGSSHDQMVYTSIKNAHISLLSVQAPWGHYTIADLDGNY